jgi:predicted DNA-binding transcriptional regulator AlpA
MSNNENKLYRMSSVKRRYDVTDRTIRNWVASGKFPIPVMINGRCTWTAEQLEAYDAQLGTRTALEMETQTQPQSNPSSENDGTYVMLNGKNTANVCCRKAIRAIT